MLLLWSYVYLLPPLQIQSESTGSLGPHNQLLHCCYVARASKKNYNDDDCYWQLCWCCCCSAVCGGVICIIKKHASISQKNTLWLTYVWYMMVQKGGHVSWLVKYMMMTSINDPSEWGHMFHKLCIVCQIHDTSNTSKLRCRIVSLSCIIHWIIAIILI